MISYLEGQLLRQGLDYAVVKAQGVGYKVYLPTSLQDSLTANKQIELHIYTYVREDAIRLYGFATVEELELFERLLGVSKIGPKVALGVLGSLSVREFKLAIINGETETLKQIKGIGNKTAKRLILELQEKVEVEQLTESSQEPTVSNNQVNEAVQGLVNLGYTKSQARQAVQKVTQEDANQDVESIIKAGLQCLSQ